MSSTTPPLRGYPVDRELVSWARQERAQRKALRAAARSRGAVHHVPATSGPARVLAGTLKALRTRSARSLPDHCTP